MNSPLNKTLRRFLGTCFFVLCTTFMYAQTGKLKGVVKDSAGKTVKGASVTIQNTKFITITDDKGSYLIDSIPAGDYSVVVDFVGYNSVEGKTSIKANETAALNFNLKQVITQLDAVQIVKSLSVHGMGHLGEVHGGVIYSGQKTEVLVLDSMDANTAQDNPREVLGRIPGSNYSETEGEGFPSNGIAFRGLRPTQSIEVQTRQNGYNITADLYGYNESYYIPPLEAVERIEVVRGASSLQFGPQFGGLINYIIKDGPLDKPVESNFSETGGSFGFISSVFTIGGTYKKWSYFSFIQYKAEDGWRPNSDLRQLTGFAKLEFQANSKFKIGLEYTLLRNKIHMPGGLTDAEFNQNPDQSFRARNWLESPWNILALTAEYRVSDNTMFTFKSALDISARNLVWRNEDGGPFQADSISPNTNSYVPREVEHEGFVSSTNELRFLTNYNIGGVNQTLACGVRYFSGNMQRQGGGPGSTGSDFDMNLYGGTWGYSLNFGTTNIAPFIENTFRIGSRISITPGFRYEYIQSNASGYITTDTGVFNVTETRAWYIPLAGLGLQIKTSNTTDVYANISQAYEPTTYDNLTPLGSTAVIDPNMKDVYGYNSDLGFRGNIKNCLNFDVGVFYMLFDNEQGNELRYDLIGNAYTYTTNVGNAVHEGIEAYIEFNPFKLLANKSKFGEISFFNSYCYDQSKYVAGPFTGNYEEMAPVSIDRLGIIYTYKAFSITYVLSNTTKSFADANNTIYSSDAEVGLIPGYQVMDVSAALHIKNYDIKAGVSNLTDAKYFNLRTNEYPGPGIIPAPARSIYVGLSARF
ncbi:MAG TPA: TonB-dependent receptor [Bacteroidia bacterium]|nr:TonB-dependent receptor [Bacteroidia bacterium]